MNESNSLISLGELSKPVTVLIEKISDAVGVIFLPHQIRRVAEADADALVIRAKANIQITEIQERAIRRLLIEEGDKQENIESITQKALPSVSTGAKPENIEKDWITNFFDKCRSISDSEMQAIWSKLLAGEANNPGSCSKRTVSLLASMDKADAELFKSLCTFVWDTGGPTPIILEVDHPIYNFEGKGVDKLIHLDSIGLISFNIVAGFRKKTVDKDVAVFYYGQQYKLQFQSIGTNSLNVGVVMFTEAGKQLAAVSASIPNPEFRDYVLSNWIAEGISVLS